MSKPRIYRRLGRTSSAGYVMPAIDPDSGVQFDRVTVSRALGIAGLLLACLALLGIALAVLV